MSMSTMIRWQLHDHPGISIPSMLYWDTKTPLEVLLVIQTGPETSDTVEWRFARDLLLDGIKHNQAGEADVQVVVNDDVMTLYLNSPFGEVYLDTSASYIGQFLAATLADVPRGKEDCGVDDAIAKIFEDFV